MDNLGFKIEKNKLVENDEQADALTRFQENVLNPVINSALIEPWNAVVSVANTIGQRMQIGPLLRHKVDFSTGETKFLSSAWLVQSVSGGLGMLLPYSISGHAAGSFLKNVGVRLHLCEEACRVLDSEAAAQILGAATYDGLREARKGETHLANALGGVTAFGTFAIGNALSKNMPLSKMIAMRTLAGAIGGSAQHAVASYVSDSKLPSLEELGRATVNGMVMSIVLPESQRALKGLVETGHEQFNPGVPLDRLFEARPQKAASSSPSAAAQSEPLNFEHMPLQDVEHAPSSYDFFVKADESSSNKNRERNRDEQPALAQQLAPPHELGFSISSNQSTFEQATRAKLLDLKPFVIVQNVLGFAPNPPPKPG